MISRARSGLLWWKPTHGPLETTMTTGITQLTTVAVHVADVDEALKFYTGPLGLEVRTDVSYGEGQRWTEVAPPGGATTIAVVVPLPGTEIGGDTGIRLGTEDADAVHAALVAAGAYADDVFQYPGTPKMFSFRDPFGNILYAVQTNFD
jgi:catechol 2,3-dioxygenase-like lactoylglutathione lyase family enzyme